MNSGRYPARSIVVLTTEERSNLFAAVIGEGADMRFSPRDTAPLFDFLVNCAVSGGRLVVLDEEHFIDVDDLMNGVEAYLDDPSATQPALDFIVVCSEREPGDPILYRLATYCGIYDLIYQCEGGEVAIALERLLRVPNTRKDVLDVLCGRTNKQAAHGERDGRGREMPVTRGEEHDVFGGAVSDEESARCPVKINIKVEIEPIKSK